MSNLESLPEPFVRRMTDYVTAGAYRTRGRHGHRIPAIVAREWAERGYAVLRTNTLARQYGVGRKTMWKTIQNCVVDGFIREIGRTTDGKAKYEPCLERGDEWRAAYEERMHGKL